jgi:cation diffusion facilitator family transporter
MKDKFEFPDYLSQKFEKAKKLEWISVVYFAITTVLMYITMGQSQTMKTAWLEDFLSLAPSVSFLIASKIYRKPHNKDFPFGYHRVVTIAYLVSALALLVVGIYLVTESLIVLVRAEHPSIGTVVIFGYQVWLGYIMILALLFGTVPSIFLGIAKIPLALELHDKNLYTDAQMNKADWMTGIAAIVGILGIGIGMWWADAVAALIISVDILHDGFKNLKQAVFDLMNQVPKTVDNSTDDPLLKQIKDVLNHEGWIKESKIRLREEGHIYFGEAFVVPKSEKNLLANITATKEKIAVLSWLLYDFNIAPVESLSKRVKQ